MAASQRQMDILTAALGAPQFGNSTPQWQRYTPGLNFEAAPLGNQPDLNKVKRNIQRMIDQNAPESDIDAYVASEGTTPEELRAHKASSSQQDAGMGTPKMPTYLLTSPDGARYRVSAPDENAAMDAFNSLSNNGASDQPVRGPWSKYQPAQGPWSKYQGVNDGSQGDTIAINIGGKRVKVGKSFLSLPQDQQHKAIDEIASQIGMTGANANGNGALPITPNSPAQIRAAREAEPTPQQLSDAAREADIGQRTRAIMPHYGLADEVTHNASMGFSDEILGGLTAPIDMATRALQGKPSLDYWESASRIAEAEKRAQENYAKENPGKSWLALGLSLPLAMGKGGGTAPNLPLGKQMIDTAKTGAATGAAYGFGEGRSLDERTSGAINGAALGGTFGALAPAFIEKIASPLAGAITRPLRGLINPEGQAAKNVAGALARDEARGSAGLSNEAYDAAVQSGQSPVLADRGGETTRALARASSNLSPEAKDALTRVTNDRFETQATRAADFVQNLFGGDAKAAKITDTLTAKAKAVNNPAYDAAHAAGENADLWTKELSDLAQAPDVMDAIKAVTRTAQNKSVIQGYKPIRNPFTVTPDGTLKPKMSLGADGSITSVKPNLAFWDTVKEGLDRKIETLLSTGQKRAAGDTIALKNKLLSELDNAVPEYKTARAGAASFFGAQDALEAGQKFVRATSSISIPDAQKALAKMSPSERGLFAQGFASDLSHAILSTPDRRNVLNQVFLNNPNAKARITLALGEKRAGQLEAYLRRESVMDGLRTAVSGNSSTAAQLAQLALFGGGGTGAGYLATGDMTKAQMIGAMMASARYGKVKIDANVAKKIGEMLASNDPKVLNTATQMVAGSSLYLKTLRSAEDFLSRIGGVTGSESRLIASPLQVFGNENNQQKEVPRHRP
jgi:hypothetical protein